MEVLYPEETLLRVDVKLAPLLMPIQAASTMAFQCAVQAKIETASKGRTNKGRIKWKGSRDLE